MGRSNRVHQSLAWEIDRVLAVIGAEVAIWHPQPGGCDFPGRRKTRLHRSHSSASRSFQVVVPATHPGAVKEIGGARGLNIFLNSPLRFLAFICYKQFTESKQVAEPVEMLQLSGLSGI
jgi:hypothetical protein